MALASGINIMYALIGINTNNDTALSTAPVPLEIPMRPGTLVTTQPAACAS